MLMRWLLLEGYKIVWVLAKTDIFQSKFLSI